MGKVIVIAEESAWEEWFSVQYDVCRQVEEVLRKGLEERPREFRAALYSALIESLAERMRQELKLS